MAPNKYRPLLVSAARAWKCSRSQSKIFKFRRRKNESHYDRPTTKQTPVCYNCLSPTRWASEWKDARGTYWFCFTCWPAATALGMTQVLPPNPLTPLPPRPLRVIFHVLRLLSSD